MMRIVKRTLAVLLVFGIFLSAYIDPASAAKKNTLGYYEEKLAEAKREYQETQNALNRTQNEIEYSKNQVEKLKQETIDLVEEVKRLNEEIEKYNDDIKTKIQESKELLEYLQLTDGKNVYLEYVFKADSVTDFINRSYTIKEIVDYNKKTVENLEQMVKDNQKRQEEIDKRQHDIAAKEEELGNSIVTLGEKKSSLTAGGVDAAKQIKIYEEYVNGYKKQGCKTNDVIGVDCAVQGGTGVFRRPTKTGYVTQEAYYTSPSKYHRALDIGSPNKEKEKIYPIADGVITSIYEDKWHALCLTIEHFNINDGKTYTSLYVHMSSYAPGLKVGNRITSEQYIGYMGMTGKATGVHLHIEVYPCRLYNQSDKNCYKWGAYDSFAIGMLKQGYGPRKLISFPSGKYNYWYSR